MKRYDSCNRLKLQTNPVLGTTITVSDIKLQQTKSVISLSSKISLTKLIQSESPRRGFLTNFIDRFTFRNNHILLSRVLPSYLKHVLDYPVYELFFYCVFKSTRRTRFSSVFRRWTFEPIRSSKQLSFKHFCWISTLRVAERHPILQKLSVGPLSLSRRALRRHLSCMLKKCTV